LEYQRIGAYDVAFDKDNHRYYVGERHVPNITQIIDDIHPQKRPRVDPEILRKAAESGNALKRMIMNYEKHDVKTPHKEMQSYISLKRQHQFDAVKLDTIVLLFQDGIAVGAGCFDMVVSSPYIDGKGIAIIKRSRHLDEARLRMQLNLYRRAFEETYKERIHYLKCLHIRGGYQDYIDVPVDRNLADELVETYIQRHPPDYTAYI